MTRKEFNEIVNEYKSYMDMKDELEAQMDSLKDEIKAYMDENGLDEYLSTETGSHIVWKMVRRPQFQPSAFRKANEELYKAYCKMIETRPFRFER